MHYAPDEAKGFTLIEVLVTIGILVVLLGILIPVVSRARRAATQTQCASNLHQIATGCVLRAQMDGGFSPLAGTVVLPPGTDAAGSVPAALGDSERKRYSYFKSGFSELDYD